MLGHRGAWQQSRAVDNKWILTVCYCEVECYCAAIDRFLLGAQGLDAADPQREQRRQKIHAEQRKSGKEKMFSSRGDRRIPDSPGACDRELALDEAPKPRLSFKERYQMGQTIGAGEFAVVKLALDRLTNVQVRAIIGRSQLS